MYSQADNKLSYSKDPKVNTCFGAYFFKKIHFYPQSNLGILGRKL